ncbi:MAG TPA: hypothetical protein VFV38_50125 [Ktedonobacteraceae bacterium]|nr:hypothetical protein [Ktedonobacteraceae bacterium]
MPKSLPMMQINQDQLSFLVAVLLVYRKYRREKTPPTEERMHTLIVLDLLISRLNGGLATSREPASLLLTEDDIHVLKAGLIMLLDRLNRKPPTAAIKQETQRLKELKTLIDQTFQITQD